ncbi:Ion channel [Trichostrongylus colubriformis]|uniref:Ion channel n=1 Tax=Trichostrongylus colubriformis TaxID=6319 RepID=A0AAN8FVR0_TRICO
MLTKHLGFKEVVHGARVKIALWFSIKEKNYDSLYGAPDYILKKPSMATSYNKPAATNPPVTTREFHRSVYWLVHNRRKYGFRHVCMLILLLIYTLLGAALFFNIETNYEHQVVDERKAVLDKRIATIAEQLILLQNGTELLVNNQMAEDFVKSTYISLLKDESLYAGSTYAKTSGDSNFKWTFASAIFFSMNIYTTTGYGSIACESMLGRICVMWYSLITIPITLVVIRDLGQCVLVYLTKLYAHILVKFRRAMGYLEPHEDSMISLPIKFCLLLLAGYLFFSAVFIYFFDEWMGYISHTGMSFFTAFYFSYISISTIGLGDIMPNNATVRIHVTLISELSRFLLSTLSNFLSAILPTN